MTRPVHWVLLDFDGAVPLDFPDRCEFLQHTLGLTLDAFRYDRSSNGGYHVCIRLAAPLEPVAVVAVQALLGSDYRRETYNLARVLELENAPAFWHSRWNVLYSSKLGRTADMIDRDSLGNSPLKADDIPGDATVLTVAVVEQTQFREKPGDPPKNKVAITFAEFPEQTYFVNVTGLRNLCDKLGNDETKWIGARVPLVKTQAPDPRTPGRTVTSLWVASLREWDQIVGKATPKTAAKKTAAKGAR